jgi:tetratricopeptide (TPR) repeat protein
MPAAKPLLTKKRLQQIDQQVREAWQLQNQGRLVEAEAGYRAALEMKPNHFDALHLLGLVRHLRGDHADALRLVGTALKIRPDYPDALSNVGIILHALNRGSEALENFDRALKFKPQSAEVHANRGNALIQLRRHEEAVACFDRALALMPNYAAAHYNRGNALLALDRLDEALSAYDRALSFHPAWPEALNNRGNALIRLGRAGEAMSDYENALKLQPGQPDTLGNIGNALNVLGRPHEALAVLEQAIAARPGAPVAHYNAAMTRILLGDYKAGWAEYEWRWLTPWFHPQRRAFDALPWLGGEPLEGKTILIHAEQGFGDMIQFARYVPLVAARGANVVLEMPEPLMALMAGLAGVSEMIAKGAAPPKVDYHCPLMSLPHAFGTELASIPADVAYLAAPADRMTKFAGAMAALKFPRVGLVWSGRPTHHNDLNRSLALAKLAALFEAPCSLVSLQRDLRESDAAALPQYPITDLSAQLGDFADTAAAISQLDLVISVDTSVAHLAGALGKPVWILLPHAPDFRWMLERNDSPWYPSARLFRQRSAGDWDSVLEAVKAALGEAVTAGFRGAI